MWNHVTECCSCNCLQLLVIFKDIDISLLVHSWKMPHCWLQLQQCLLLSNVPDEQQCRMCDVHIRRVYFITLRLWRWNCGPFFAAAARYCGQLNWFKVTLYKWCTPVSGTFSHVTRLMSCRHEGGAQVATFQPRDNIFECHTNRRAPFVLSYDQFFYQHKQ